MTAEVVVFGTMGQTAPISAIEGAITLVQTSCVFFLLCLLVCVSRREIVQNNQRRPSFPMFGHYVVAVGGGDVIPLRAENTRGVRPQG